MANRSPTQWLRTSYIANSMLLRRERLYCLLLPSKQEKKVDVRQQDILERKNLLVELEEDDSVDLNNLREKAGKDQSTLTDMNLYGFS